MPPEAAAMTRCTRSSFCGRTMYQASTLNEARITKNRSPNFCASLSCTDVMGEEVRAALLLWRHAQRAVEADRLAVQHRVLDNVPRQGGKLTRLSQARREWNLRCQDLTLLIWHHAQHGRVEGA